MHELTDSLQIQIKREDCDQHGIYFEVRDFKDYKYETLMHIFRTFVFAIRKE